MDQEVNIAELVLAALMLKRQRRGKGENPNQVENTDLSKCIF
jgi:hypothetical protein